MPAISIDDGSEKWQIESSQILVALGFAPISDEDLRAVQGAWRGVLHRADNPFRFLAGFARVGDRSTSFFKRSMNNFLRAYIAFYMMTLISFAKVTRKPTDPENFGDQFLVWERTLESSTGQFVDGDVPGIRDLLLFGVVQCHASIPVPPLEALQNDKRLAGLRQWIATMQKRFSDCTHLYSGRYFEPHLPQPEPATLVQRTIFYLGILTMVGLFPVTLPSVFVLMRKVPR